MATAAPSRSRIFISYRHEDTDVAVGRLADDLRKHFTREQVFQDFASIEPGTDFTDAVQHGLDTCAAVLVIIGPRWLTTADCQGQRRLDLPDDWVAHEIAESLRRPEVRVFPVLVDADMPRSEELPEPLRPLTRRQAFPLTSRHWPNDVGALIAHLKKVPGLLGTATPDAGTQQPFKPGVDAVGLSAKLPWKVLAGIGLMLGIVVLVLYTFLPERPVEGPSTTRDQSRAPAQPVPTTPTPKVAESFRDCERCPEMVVLPGGTFLMGSPGTEADRLPNEGPQHRVTLARAFAIGKYEVTFAEWDACIVDGGCMHKPADESWGRGPQPVINVTWKHAQAYVNWLAKKTRKPYRLLSEAEWEYAARGGTATRYPWGDDAGRDHANFAGSGSEWSGRRTAPVGSFEPNRFGLHEMIGNVDEWVQDCWADSYDVTPSDGSALESGDCSSRVARGGSFYIASRHVRAASRGGLPPDYAGSNLGLRVAVSILR